MSEKNILIVDDEEEVLNLLAKKFIDNGYRVITAQRGQEAIDKARAHKPHLILMDIILPDIGGPEAVKIIKEDPDTRNIPVIFISGIVSKEEEYIGSGIQVNGIKYHTMAKPFSFQDLMSEVNKILSEE